MSILTSKVSFTSKLVASACPVHEEFGTSSFMLAVSPGQPISISDDPDAVTLIGSSQDAANQINKKEIHWGVSAFFILVVNEEVISYFYCFCCLGVNFELLCLL
jgi:hypothetical protein